MQVNRHITQAEQEMALLYRNYAPGLLAYVRVHIPSIEDAEDLVVEVFTAALENAKFAALSEKERQLWLWRVTRNKVIDTYRRAKTRQNVALEQVADGVGIDCGQAGGRRAQLGIPGAKLVELADAAVYDCSRALRRRPRSNRRRGRHPRLTWNSDVAGWAEGIRRLGEPGRSTGPAAAWPWRITLVPRYTLETVIVILLLLWLLGWLVVPIGGGLIHLLLVLVLIVVVIRLLQGRSALP